MSNKVFFGSREVEENLKQNLVNDVFSSVVHKYDLMNDIMSFGMHRLWKDALITHVPSLNDKKFLDVASGTCDIVKKLYKRAKQENAKAEIIATDINPDMLSLGRDKMIDAGIIGDTISYVCANAEKLPFNDNEFDFYSIAFGIRNVTNINQALKEAFRVLRPGGKFLCLELSPKQDSKFFAGVYRQYSKLIPCVGDVLVGDKDSYQYLIESIQKFPSQNAFAAMIEEAGFEMVKYENLVGGVAAIHIGYKI